MRISGEVDVGEIDSHEVWYENVCLDLFLEDLLKVLKLKINSDPHCLDQLTIVKDEEDET